MKKILFSLAVMTAAFFTTSCDKSDATESVEPSISGTPVTLSVTTEGAQTRGFLDDIGATQPWENTMQYIVVFVYDDNGKLAMKKVYSGEAMKQNKMTLILPDARPGEVYTVYAAANIQSDNYENEADLLLKTELDPAPNTSFGTLTSEAVGNNQFHMSGYSTLTIAPINEQNTISIDMKKLVIKSAIETTIDLADTHTGAAKITKVYFTHNRRTPLFDIPYASTLPDVNGLLSQIPNEDNGKFQNLFYVTESADGWPMTFYVRYDKDGDFSTIDDQVNGYTTFTVPNKDYKRGDVMRLKVNLKVKGDLDPEVSYSVNDWEDSEIVDSDHSVMI